MMKEFSDKKKKPFRNGKNRQEHAEKREGGKRREPRERRADLTEERVSA